ncbi:MAG: UvrB/UvrC motif-containing protein [Gemmatimonadetes bacterium]|nr:UvrB/UvrC motif-containing protein [Gemmatimonadota bacterium]
MKCGVCAKREAVVAYTHIVDDVKQTLLLCQECAKEKNIEVRVAPAEQTKDAPVLMKEIKIELAKLAGAEGDGDARCPTCGMSYEEFKKVGRLGCPHCYDAFSSQLERLLKRIHGDNRHRGKGPLKVAQSAPAPDELERLRAELAQAVAEEAFEEAAQLRDRIRVLEGK